MARDGHMEVEDPLKDYTGFSLFSRTLSSLSLPNPPQDPRYLHDFLKSLPVRNADKLIMEAKSILDSAKEVQNPKLSSCVVSEDENSDAVLVGEKAAEYPRGQRPGLGRKRPRFSIIPNIRQSSANLEPTLDFDKLKDPEEFFAAFERLENAKKEIAKQAGCPFVDSDQYNVFNVPRSQRPGIEGRSRTAKYIHLYPTMPSQGTSEVHVQSDSGLQQEMVCTASQQIQSVNAASQELKPIDDSSQQTESVNAVLEEIELSGSVVKVEKRVAKLLDDLLASEELEGDGSLNLLQDRLQIRPLPIEKLNLPELQDIQRTEFKASEVNLSKPRNVLSDINNLLKATRSKSPTKLKDIRSSVHSIGSPTPPKSPLASLSLLKRRIFQSNPSSDPFSADDIDQPPARNASHMKNTNIYSEPTDLEKALGMSGNLNSQTNEENNGTFGRMSSTKVAIEDFAGLFEKRLNERLMNFGIGGEVDLGESSPVLDNNNVRTNNEVVNENMSQTDADADVDLQTNGFRELENIIEIATSGQPDQEVDEFLVGTSKSIQDKLEAAAADKHAMGRSLGVQDGAPEQAEEIAVEQHNEVIQERIVVSKSKHIKRQKHPSKGRHNKSLSRGQSLADPTMVENQAMDMCPENQDSSEEQTRGNAKEQNNEKIQEPSMTSIDEGTRATLQSTKQQKRKDFSRRQSLAACGMSWETGVRRSTRIKSRPLEYWKGEKFLYGRIHESLATVIGVKYASPGKDDGKPILKVKSFVSDEYKALVEQAALY